MYRLVVIYSHVNKVQELRNIKLKKFKIDKKTQTLTYKVTREKVC